MARRRAHQRRPRPHRRAWRLAGRHRRREGRHRQARFHVRAGRDLAGPSPDLRRGAGRRRLGPRRGLRLRPLGVGARRPAVDLRTPAGVIDDVFIPLHGAHQTDNAAVALAAAEAFFGRRLDDDLVREAFARVRMPGRFEVVHREPTVVLDAAHNIDGALACSATLAEEFTLNGSLIMVVGLLDGRDPRAMLDALDAPDAGFLVACTPDSPRAVPAPVLAGVAERLGVAAEAVSSVEDAVQRALAVASPDDLVSSAVRSMSSGRLEPSSSRRWMHERDRRSSESSARCVFVSRHAVERAHWCSLFCNGLDVALDLDGAPMSGVAPAPAHQAQAPTIRAGVGAARSSSAATSRRATG